MAEKAEKEDLSKAAAAGAGAVLGLSGAGSLAGALAARKQKKKKDPRYTLGEASKTRSQMLRDKIEASQGKIDEKAVEQQAEASFTQAMQEGQKGNIEALRSSMSGALQPGQQLEMFSKATEKAQEEAAKASREAYKQAGEQKLKQADQAYALLKEEEDTLKKERMDKLFDKIPRMVGAAGVTLNKLAESGFLDDIIGIGGAIAGGAGGVLGGPAGIAAGASGGFTAGQKLGESVQDAIVSGDIGKPKDEDEEDPEAEEPAAEEPAAEEPPAEEPAEAEAPAEAEQPDAELSARERRLRDSLAGGIQGAALAEEIADAVPDAPQEEPAEEDPAKAAARERMEARQQARDEGVGEGGFEQDADDLDVLGVGQAEIGGVPVENEVQHANTLAEAQNLPGLMGGIVNVGDFNKAAADIFESQDPAAVSATYIAAGVRPPNDAVPTPEQIAQARAAANQPGSELNLAVKALQSDLRKRGALLDNMRNNLTQ